MCVTRHSPWHTRRARLFPALALPATLSLPGLALAPTAVASDIAPPAPPAAVAWTEPLADQPKPPAAEVLRDAPALGRVSLVTVRAREGRPVATITVAANRTEAATLVGQARINPEVLAVSVTEEVHAEQLRDPLLSQQRTLERLRAAAVPDPLISRQWALTTLKAAQIWPQTTASGVVVAVVDSGVDAGHPDLAGAVLAGTDLVAPGTGQSDPNGHGTHVAGVIAAVANNGIGVAGLAPGARILPVRVLDASGAGTDAALANGIVWAVDRGASVINLSVGTADYSPAEAAAVAYAVQRGAVVIAAAGNTRTQGNPVTYPAAFPSVVGVGALDRTNRVAGFSSSGSYVDVVAPGVGILSTSKRSYTEMDGTSAATPLVSATAALVRAAAPRLTGAQVAALLQSTAADVESAGRDALSGSGLVQPLAAVAAAQRTAPAAAAVAPVSAVTVASAPSRAVFGATVTVSFRITVAGKALAGVPMSICRSAAPTTKDTCSTVTSNASGLVSTTAVVTGHLSVHARYGGSTRATASMARPIMITALTNASIQAGTRSLTLRINPVAPNQRITIQRLVSGRWTTATTRVMPTNGVLTVTGLVSRGTYRAAVPETDRTAAVTSGVVTVR